MFDLQVAHFDLVAQFVEPMDRVSHSHRFGQVIVGVINREQDVLVIAENHDGLALDLFFDQSVQRQVDRVGFGLENGTPVIVQ